VLSNHWIFKINNWDLIASVEPFLSYRDGPLYYSDSDHPIKRGPSDQDLD